MEPRFSTATTPTARSPMFRARRAQCLAATAFHAPWCTILPLLGAAIGHATNGGQLGNAPGLVQSVGLGATHTFSPTLLLDWNFGFTRQRLGSTFDLTSARGVDQLGILGTNNAGAPGDPSLYYGYPGFIFPVAQVPPGT